MSLRRRVLCTCLLRHKRLLVVMSGREEKKRNSVYQKKKTALFDIFLKAFLLIVHSPAQFSTQELVSTLTRPFKVDFKVEEELGDSLFKYLGESKTYHKTNDAMLILACCAIRTGICKDNLVTIHMPPWVKCL